MSNLILVRHSLPEITPSVPASQWRLSETGRSRCHVLADKIAHYAPTVVVSSVEPKAIETAQIIANHIQRTFHVVEGLHEHVRSGLGWEGQERFEARLADFFRHPQELVLGQETAGQAYERFARAVSLVIEEQPNRNIAVVAHGTVITLFVTRATGLEPFPFWKRLGLPSFVVLSLPQKDLVTIVADVEADTIAEADVRTELTARRKR